jgi:predicted nucleic acid-binding protein
MENRRLILLADANVVIDLYLVEGLPLVAEIASAEILDYVLEEVDSLEQPGIREKVMESSISVVRAEQEWIKHVTEKGLSMQDKLNLHYVRQNHRVMLTGEKRMRNICSAEGIEVHGTLWLIDQAKERELRSLKDICRWLDRLSQPDRFLPDDEIQKRREAFGCSRVA